MAPARIPVENIISNVKSTIRRIEESNIQELVRQNITYILRITKPPKREIFHDEFQAVKALNNSENIIRLSPGNATVVMKTKYYKSTKDMNDQVYIKTPEFY